MVNAETLKYCQRAVIRYINGDMAEFQRLVRQAMAIYNAEIEICECGAEMIKAEIKHNKENKKVWMCTKCRKWRGIEDGNDRAMSNNDNNAINDSRIHSKKNKRKKDAHRRLYIEV